uniref:Basic helix-loop-helix DNA-binding superfamily protein 120b n=1 Tax=Eriobotrya japonica TaxID=32224 RepID=A0A5P9Q428_9ROSA|nr:basic helix-loop-helix DNA-binding superfamily protein 120b [Eriobotrya japonica]
MDVGMFNNFNTGGQRRKSSLPLTSDGAKNQDKSNDEDEKKKVMHREIEKKRRQEMANLYGSLRSVLPLEFIKGKRSLADHMNEAVNYIKQLQTRIKIFGAKRGELKMGSASSNLSASTLGHGSSGSSSTSTSTLVAVHPCLAGVEIVVSTAGSAEQFFLLSRMLKILLGQGLNVISCATAQVNKRLVYTIQSEVSDPTCIDFSGLQQILTEACCH